MSGDPEQEYFADGISEDLITGLARIRWLFVIARNSTFVYKHRAVDVKQVSRELGVRYVLEGSVRRAGKRLRISAQLIDATTGGHHWAERYDRELGDIFAVQDEITRSVAAAIEPRLLAAEGVRALSRSADDLGAWELVARAQTHFWRMTQSGLRAAIDASKRAVETYPDYAPARSLLAFLPGVCRAHGVGRSRQGLLAGRRARLCGPSPSTIMIPGGTSRWAIGRSWNAAPRSDRAFARAVDLNPNSAAAHAHLGRGLAFPGRDREAIEHAEEAIRLSPFDPVMALFSGLSRLPTTPPGDMRELPNTRRKPCGCARVFRARTVCAAQAWPRQGVSTKRDRFSQRSGATNPSCRSIGSGQTFPTRRPS